MAALLRYWTPRTGSYLMAEWHTKSSPVQFFHQKKYFFAFATRILLCCYLWDLDFLGCFFDCQSGAVYDKRQTIWFLHTKTACPNRHTWTQLNECFFLERLALPMLYFRNLIWNKEQVQTKATHRKNTFYILKNTIQYIFFLKNFFLGSIFSYVEKSPIFLLTVFTLAHDPT